MTLTEQRDLAPAQFISAAPIEAVDPSIVFPQGLVGCPDWQRFVLLVDSDEELPVAVLQCIDDTDVQFLVSNPLLLDPTYSVALSAEDRAALSLTPDIQPVTYCTLTVATDGSITANLLGPLVVNPVTRQARQLVALDSVYSTLHPVASATAN
jgi:flagellar assembly factor FliW